MIERVLPSRQQLAYMDWEFGLFFHFGIRSFFKGHQDWDKKPMPASAFNPEHLDCEQWIRDGKAAGARYAILTAKHHDGFCNWPSRYTEYSVKNSPWKDGKGDVVAEFTAACRKYDMRAGLYCSPAQWSGGTDFLDERAYDDYFIHQLTELLTGYGKIDYIWFDGCGSNGHTFDAARIVGAVRALQQDICIFEMWDPDTRWVENEAGYAHMPNRNAVGETDHTRQFLPGGVFPKPRFLPAECDFMMRDRTWFDCMDNEQTVKSVEELMGIYEMSVGRGANFLLNIGPTAKGCLPEPDTKRLLEFGQALRRRYGNPAAGFAKVEESEGRYVIASESEDGGLVNRVVIQEDLSQGESVLRFSLYFEPSLYSPRPICLYRGATIGHKAICIFPTVRAKKIILQIDEQDGPVAIKSMQPFMVKTV
jgi:alpha-L-fucosidase